MSNNGKNNLVQAARGICIILVILIHCVNGKVYENGSANYWYGIMLRQFINFPVAVFVFLSAYYTDVNKIDLKYIKRRCIRLTVPYIVWSILYLLIDILDGGERIGIARMIRKLLLGGCEIQLYFIVVLLQMTFITPCIIKFYKRSKVWHYVFVAITPLYFVLIYLYRFFYGMDIPLRLTFFAAWFVFYWLGLYCRIEKRQFLFKNKIFPIIIAILVSCFEAVMLEKIFTYDLAVSQLKIGSCLLGIGVINIIISKKDSWIMKKKSFLVQIGNLSYGIYYIHMIGIRITSYFIKLYELTYNYCLPFVQVLQLFVTFILSVSIIYIGKKIIGKDLANKLFGF